MTTDEIKAALERAEKATAGPWLTAPHQIVSQDGRGICSLVSYSTRQKQTEAANTALITNARTDVPRLARALLVALAALQQTKADCQAQRERGEVDIRGPIYSLNQALKEISAL